MAAPSSARVLPKGLALTKPRPREISSILKNAKLTTFPPSPLSKCLQIDSQQRRRPDVRFPAATPMKNTAALHAMLVMGWRDTNTGNRSSIVVYIGGAMSEKGVLNGGLGLLRGSPASVLCVARSMSTAPPKNTPGPDSKGIHSARIKLNRQTFSMSDALERCKSMPRHVSTTDI
jgi:hypothetical protein